MAALPWSYPSLLSVLCQSRPGICKPSCPPVSTDVIVCKLLVHVKALGAYGVNSIHSFSRDIEVYGRTLPQFELFCSDWLLGLSLVTTVQPEDAHLLDLDSKSHLSGL